MQSLTWSVGWDADGPPQEVGHSLIRHGIRIEVAVWQRANPVLHDRAGEHAFAPLSLIVLLPPLQGAPLLLLVGSLPLLRGQAALHVTACAAASVPLVSQPEYRLDQKNRSVATY